MKKSILFAALLALAIPSLHARTWTSADGTKTFEGDLRSYNPTTGEVTVLINGRATTFQEAVLSEADRTFLKEEGAKTAGAPADDPTAALEGQKVGAQVLKAKLHRIEGERYKRAELTKTPEYYIMYFSASW